MFFRYKAGQGFNFISTENSATKIEIVEALLAFILRMRNILF